MSLNISFQPTVVFVQKTAPLLQITTLNQGMAINELLRLGSFKPLWLLSSDSISI